MTKYNIKFYRGIKKLSNFYLDKMYKPIVINSYEFEEPVLLIGNHKSGKDIMMLMYALENHDLRFMAKKEHFETIYANLFYKCGAFPIDREKNDFGAVRTAVNLLKNNENVVIFPEGTRNRTEEILLPFKKGFTGISLLGNAKIIPFAIKGEYKFRSHPTIVFGDIIDLKNIDIPKNEMDDYVKDKVLTLLKND